jgi:SPP1 gp7 family putative phage head morphogenesis protein
VQALRALRASANMMHRDARGKLRRGHPFRGRLPRQTKPDAIAAAWSIAIKAMAVGTIRHALAPLLEALPSMVGSADADRQVRTDVGEGDRSRRYLDRARSELSDAVGGAGAKARQVADATQRHQAGQLRNQLRARVGVDIFFNDRTLAARVDHFAHENVALIKSLGNRTLDKIGTRVARGFSAGHRAEEIAKDIQDEYDIAERHANLIARDQVGKLNGQINAARQQELGITHFVWRTVHDERVREEHAHLDGETFAYADPPSEGIPGEPVNCRCFAEPVIDL